jgi:chemotaxis protein methyltransferase CheR
MDITLDNPQLVPGVSTQIYSRSDFEAIRKIAYDTAGILLSPCKATLVYSRLASLVRNSDTHTFSCYIDLVRENETELRKAINALTTNHTFFNREKHHFEHITEHVRPAILAKARAGEAIRIWSAGCASGEEAYSLAMTLLGSNRAEAQDILSSNTIILATDLADQAVATSKAARYPSKGLAEMPPKLVRIWSREADGETQMSDDIRRLVRVRRLNLFDEWPMRCQFDVIFCRNVLIYFDDAGQDRLVARLSDRLVRGGYLYIGHSEQVRGLSERHLKSLGGTIYQKNAL